MIIKPYGMGVVKVVPWGIQCSSKLNTFFIYQVKEHMGEGLEAIKYEYLNPPIDGKSIDFRFDLASEYYYLMLLLQRNKATKSNKPPCGVKVTVSFERLLPKYDRLQLFKPKEYSGYHIKRLKNVSWLDADRYCKEISGNETLIEIPNYSSALDTMYMTGYFAGYFDDQLPIFIAAWSLGKVRYSN